VAAVALAAPLAMTSAARADGNNHNRNNHNRNNRNNLNRNNLNHNNLNHNNLNHNNHNNLNHNNNRNHNNHKNNNANKKYIVRYICPEWKQRTYWARTENDAAGAFHRAENAIAKLRAIGCEANYLGPIGRSAWSPTIEYRLTSERSWITTDLAKAKLKARQLRSLGFEVHLQEYKGQ
jgi:hypothetical protein